MRKGWLRPGEPANDAHTQYVMPDTFNPAMRGNFGHEVIYTPKNEWAPRDLVNYTPATGEVHDVGQWAPKEHDQVSIRPTGAAAVPAALLPSRAAPVLPRLPSRGWAGGGAGAVGMGQDDDGDGYDDETGEPVDDGSDFEQVLDQIAPGLPASVRSTLTDNPPPKEAVSDLNSRLHEALTRGGPSTTTTTPPKANDNSKPQVVRTTNRIGGRTTDIEPGDFPIPEGPALGIIPAGGYSPLTQQGRTPTKIYLGPNKGYDLYDPLSGEKVGHLGPGGATAPGGQPAKPEQTRIYLGPGKGYDVYEGDKKVGHIGPEGTGASDTYNNATANPNQKLIRIGQVARAVGLNDEGARVLQAVATTEGGLTGAAGDGGQSKGPFQFYEGGQMPAFRQWLQAQGIQGDANTLVHDVDLATRFAATTYLGNAVRQGQAQGLSGADLATYVQKTGQVSKNPEVTGQNYQRLFGSGNDPFNTPTPGAAPIKIYLGPGKGYDLYDEKTHQKVGHLGPEAGASTGSTASAAGANTRFHPVTDGNGNVFTIDQATGEQTLVSTRNPWRTMPGGNGSIMRVNVETGETQQLNPEASRQANRSIFQQNPVTGQYEEVVRAPADLKVQITADGKRITTIDPDTGAGRIIWVEDNGGLRNIPGMGILVPPGKKVTVQTRNGPVVYDGGKPNGPPVRMQDIPGMPGRTGPPQGAGGPGATANAPRVVDTANAQPGRGLISETYDPDKLDQGRAAIAAEGQPASASGGSTKVPSPLELFGALDYSGISDAAPFTPGAGPGPAGSGDSIYEAWKANQSPLADTGGMGDLGGFGDTGGVSPDESPMGWPSSDDQSVYETSAPYYEDPGQMDVENNDGVIDASYDDGSGDYGGDYGEGQSVGYGEASPGPVERGITTGPDPTTNPVIDPPPPPPAQGPGNDPSGGDDFGGRGPAGGDLSSSTGSRGAGSTSYGGVRGRLSGRLATGRSLEGWEPVHAATSTDVLGQELASSTGAPPPAPPTPEPPAVGTGSDQPAHPPASGWTPPIPEGDIVGGGNKFGDNVSMEGVHKGTDLQAVKGTPTVSPVTGIVTRVEFKKAGLGLQVVIRDEDGQEHRLSHLDKALVEPGQMVEKGEQVATVGESGTGATGPHLDYRVEQDGQEIDPEPMMGDLAQLPPHPDTIQEDGSVGAAGMNVGTGKKMKNTRHNPMNLDMHNGGVGNDLRMLAMNDQRSGGERPTFGPSGMWDQAGNVRSDFSGNWGKWGKAAKKQGYFGVGADEENGGGQEDPPPDDGGFEDPGGGGDPPTEVTDPFTDPGGGVTEDPFDPSNLGTLIPSGTSSPFPRATSGASSGSGRTASGRSSGGGGGSSHDALQAAQEQIAWDREKFAQQLAWEQSQFGQQLGWDQSKFVQDLTWQEQKWMQDLQFQKDKLNVEVQRLNSDAQAEYRRYQVNLQQAQTQRAAAVEEMRHNKAMEILGRYQAQLDERNQALNRQQQRVLQGTYAQHRQAELQDSALKNPWVQSLTGMAPEYATAGGPGWVPGATPNGYQTLMGGYTPMAPPEEPWEPIPAEPKAPGTDVSGSDPNDPANIWLNSFLATNAPAPADITNPNTPTPGITAPTIPQITMPTSTYTPITPPSIGGGLGGSSGSMGYSSLADAMYGEGLQGVGHYDVDNMSQDDLNDWLKHLWEGGSGWDDPRIVKIMQVAQNSGYDTSIYNQWKSMGNQPLGTPFPSGASRPAENVPTDDPGDLGAVIRDPAIDEQNPNVGGGQRSRPRHRRVGRGSRQGGVHGFETPGWALPHTGPERMGWMP